MENAPCRTATDVFFTNIWPDIDDEKPNADALEYARGVCLECPFRAQCIVMVMEDERSKSAQNRYGMAATLTPSQRWLLEKRGTMRCEQCHAVLDPDRVRKGWLNCRNCKHARPPVAPLPEFVDEWQPRHTTLAHRMLDFVRDHELGDELPSATALADAWGVRRHDVVRVYEEFDRTGEIAVRGNVSTPCYVRIGESTGAWHPAHLTS